MRYSGRLTMLSLFFVFSLSIISSIALHIHDNGKGFDPSLLCGKRTFGLSGMQERVSILDGKFNIASRVGIGTDISIHLPVGSTNNVR